MFDRQGKPIVSVPGVKPDWKADAFVLERRHKSRWAQVTKVEHTGVNGAPIMTATATMTPEELQKKIDEDRKAMEECGED